MPTYEYDCANCGPFSAVRKISEYREPGACPQCAGLAPRAHFTSPASSGGLFARMVTSDVSAQARYVCEHGRARGGMCGCRFK